MGWQPPQIYHVACCRTLLFAGYTTYDQRNLCIVDTICFAPFQYARHYKKMRLFCNNYRKAALDTNRKNYLTGFPSRSSSTTSNPLALIFSISFALSPTRTITSDFSFGRFPAANLFTSEAVKVFKSWFCFSV